MTEALKALGEPRPRPAAASGPKAPLRLSYTMIKEYEKCPRCFYLKMVLGFPEAISPGVTLGTISHDALRKFFVECALPR